MCFYDAKLIIYIKVDDFEILFFEITKWWCRKESCWG